MPWVCREVDSVIPVFFLELSSYGESHCFDLHVTLTFETFGHRIILSTSPMDEGIYSRR